MNINLYRGNNPNNKNPILYPILKAFLLSNGRIRKEDIKTYEKTGELWVDSMSGGVSLFDKIGIPVKSWEYYLIGKKIPYGLVITKDEWNKRFQSNHYTILYYTIRPQWDMPVLRFCFLLDELATGLRGV